MTDWADEIAKKLLWAFMVDDDINESEEDFAAALRQARSDALEEAANWCGRQASALSKLNRDNAKREAFVEAHNAIRALKDKRP